jgi:pimeloyl-ACP methyl ester carboxylesterase
MSRRDWCRESRRSTMKLQIVVLFALLLSMIACSSKPVNQSDDRMVDIGTHSLHIYCAGQGSPTVVMDTGFGDASDKLRPIQARIAQEVRVCVYDRAGYGLSEPGPMPRHGRQVASELKLLLEKAGIPGPYLLVGHSLGGLNVQVFASQYPKLVAGIVLIEPPPLRFILGQQFPDLYQRAQQEGPNMLAMAEQARTASRLKEASFLETLASEHEMMLSETAQQLAAVESFGNIPLIVMGAGQPQPAFGDQAQAFQQFWIESGQALASKSSRGAFVLVQESGHYIYRDAPDSVLEAIRQVIKQVRRS